MLTEDDMEVNDSADEEDGFSKDFDVIEDNLMVLIDARPPMLVENVQGTVGDRGVRRQYPGRSRPQDLASSYSRNKLM